MSISVNVVSKWKREEHFSAGIRERAFSFGSEEEKTFQIIKAQRKLLVPMHHLQPIPNRFAVRSGKYGASAQKHNLFKCMVNM